jgi:hypothetical protein
MSHYAVGAPGLDSETGDTANPAPASSSESAQ